MSKKNKKKTTPNEENTDLYICADQSNIDGMKELIHFDNNPTMQTVIDHCRKRANRKWIASLIERQDIWVCKKEGSNYYSKIVKIKRLRTLLNIRGKKKEG